MAQIKRTPGGPPSKGKGFSLFEPYIVLQLYNVTTQGVYNPEFFGTAASITPFFNENYKVDRSAALMR